MRPRHASHETLQQSRNFYHKNNFTNLECFTKVLCLENLELYSSCMISTYPPPPHTHTHIHMHTHKPSQLFKEPHRPRRVFPTSLAPAVESPTVPLTSQMDLRRVFYNLVQLMLSREPLKGKPLSSVKYSNH